MVPSDSRTFRLSQWITPRPMGHGAGGSPKLGPELSGESLMSVVRVGPAEVRRLGPAHRKRSRFSASCCPVRASGSKGLDLATELIKRYQPDVVLAMLLADRNPEHGETGDVTYRAFVRAAREGAHVGD